MAAGKSEHTKRLVVNLEALEQDLPADSSIAEIEQAMLKHYRAMMSETLQLLAQRQELPPP